MNKETLKKKIENELKYYTTDLLEEILEECSEELGCKITCINPEKFGKSMLTLAQIECGVV